MAGGVKKNSKLSGFLKSGIYSLPDSNAVFIDPVRILNRNYTRFRVSRNTYYSRFFNLNPNLKFPNEEEEQAEEAEESKSRVSANNRKRKRNQKKKCSYALNEKELIADQRHQEIRPLLVKAVDELVGAKELLEVMCELNCELEGWEPCVDSNEVSEEVSFVELGRVWQAPLYEIALDLTPANELRKENGDFAVVQHDDQRLFPLFNTLVLNESSDDVVAEFLASRYILPKESCFYMSDLGQIRSFVPEDSDRGFNFMMIDPPWENRSAYQKSMYLTLPNRYFLSIPIRELTHTKGALVALWVTNREKLRNFVENELFPAWGVAYMATWYWLKVKADGSLICDLDVFHHRPYECLLLGYSGKEANEPDVLSMAKSLKDKQVMITIPGDYSRKPPIGELLEECVPGPRPARCIELFAREMMAGWTSWGNEPLHFQDVRYFSRKMTESSSI